MRRNTFGWIGGLLIVLGLVAVIVGGAIGGTSTPWGSMMGPGSWMGPGMMGSWGGGTVGSAPSPGPTGPGESPSGNVVRMLGSRFAPTQLTVTAGASVTWLNDDDEPHTVTAIDGSWSSGFLAPGATYSRTFASGGSFSYVCQYHPWMQATITVR